MASKNSKNKRGRPKKLSLEELKKGVESYFKEGMYYSVTGKKKDPYPTIGGLALWLGYSCRQSLQQSIDRGEEDDEFVGTLKKARAAIEKYYEELLQEGKSTAIFALKNFGWTDKQEIEQSTTHEFPEISKIKIVNAQTDRSEGDPGTE